MLHKIGRVKQATHRTFLAFLRFLLTTHATIVTMIINKIATTSASTPPPKKATEAILAPKKPITYIQGKKI